MYISEINLSNYRNYGSLRFEPSPDINYIYGENAQGKTNLVEAVYYLLGGHSYKTRNERELVKWEEISFRLNGKIQGIEKDRTVVDILFSTIPRQKKIKVNGREVKKENYLSMFPVIIFHPEDLLMIKEGPVLRRKFLNQEISKIYPAYWKYLHNYYRALRQRNHLLRKNEVNIGNLETWDDSLIYYGGKLIYLRLMFLKKIQEHLNKVHPHFSDDREDLSLNYQNSVDIKIPEEMEEEERTKLERGIHQKFEEVIKKTRKQQIERGYTFIGPQADDFSFYINEKEVKRFASQGQQRTAVLSLKLALFSILEEKEKSSILLLDDVFSELDERRRKNVLELIKMKRLQCFITGFEKDIIPEEETLPLSIFKLQRGVLYCEESRTFN